MGSLSPELSFLQNKNTNNIKPFFYPKLINDFLSEIPLIGSSSEKLSRVDDFLYKLNEEKSKIELFKRELPLSMQILDEVIETVNEELIQYKKRNCEDEKMKWMSSCQLWTNVDSKETQESNRNKSLSSHKLAGIDPLKSGNNMTATGAFVPFQGFNTFPTMAKGKENKASGLSLPGISFHTPETLNPKEEVGLGDHCTNTPGKPVTSIALGGLSKIPVVRPSPQQQSASRKQRRCWSPELHKWFVHCLQQLGGHRVATPKQIKELMNVDGLTNDEVKSHLQKYRIHTRRIPNGRASSENGSSMEYNNFLVGESLISSSPEGPFQ